MKRNILVAEGSIMLVKVELPEGFQGELDQHVEEQVSYIETGKLEFTLDGKVNVLSTGDTLFMPSNVPHQVKVIEACTIIDVFTPIRSSLLKN
ncbi:cupin domain-containing protein [Paenisporosarcina antarctica]|uniref:Cupin domain-containing protein n=1 Tax=Paenisporosarcina antarctica TaxID=417367 RepID=A0A4P6ZZY7_9BACL|nr:cupin domain-containing protein [Paenisporosarcina antarctica]QBP41868.1 cupin domain-containing protein [Paenisporosarcina antarctica]